MYQTVEDCYKDQSVFITGGTGFVGKVLLEKLLYSCPGIYKVYLLVRENKDTTAQQKIQTIVKHPLFSRIKEKDLLALNKIVPIVGDISQPELGIKKEDRQLLADKVTFVFHVAANVQFNRPLADAMNTNVGGTERMLDLCKSFKNLKAFVYVSTAYSQTDKHEIDEIVYPAPLSIDEVNKQLETGISEEKLNDMLSGRPNTYALSKAIAENLVANNHGHMPTVIIRPSIVTSSKSEPIIGFVDNFNGASGFSITVMKGWNYFLFGRGDNYADLIPVDYVSNLAIVSAAKCAGSEVYNICSSGINPLTYRHFIDQLTADSRKHKFNEAPLVKVFFTASRRLLSILTYIFHLLPAYVADVFLLLTGKNKKYVNMQSKAIRIRDKLDYFTSHSWVISVTRTRALFRSLSPSDRCQFPFDPADIDWKVYIPTFCQGLRQYLDTISQNSKPGMN